MKITAGIVIVDAARNVGGKAGQTFLVTDVRADGIILGRRFVKTTQKFSGKVYWIGNLNDPKQQASWTQTFEWAPALVAERTA